MGQWIGKLLRNSNFVFAVAIITSFFIGLFVGIFWPTDYSSQVFNERAWLRVSVVGANEKVKLVKGIRVTELSLDDLAEGNAGFYPVNQGDTVFPHIVPSTHTFIAYGGPCFGNSLTITIQELVKRISVVFNVDECRSSVSFETDKSRS